MDQYWTLIPEEEGQIVTSLLFLYIFREAFETSGLVRVCVCVSIDRTQSGVSNCNCPAQSARAPLVLTALNQFQQTQLSDEARGHVFC